MPWVSLALCPVSSEGLGSGRTHLSSALALSGAVSHPECGDYLLLGPRG